MDFNAQSVQLKKEEQKFARLALTFLYKTMEAIYSIRCPKQVDFVEEDKNSSWFNLNIPRSNSLRQKLQSSFYHGWFSIDICLTDNQDFTEIIERWYLIHIPVKQTETLPSLSTNLKDLKFHTYRRFSQILRSIYSMINALPATTLSIVLQQLTTTKRRIVANVSGFQKFPAQITSFCEEETAKIRFGPIVTPIGQSVVICHYRLDLQPLIPTPIRTAPHYKFGSEITNDNQNYEESGNQNYEMQNQNYDMECDVKYDPINDINVVFGTPIMNNLQTSGQNVNDTYGTSVPSSNLPLMTPNSHVDFQSFVPDSMVGNFEPYDGKILKDKNSNNETEEIMPVSEFIEYLESCKQQKCADILGNFENHDQLLARVRDELDVLKSE
ncbi:hypothetical protein TRFO_04082 [Tritrichomonas foetus]|uniref:Autophagy-related protein 13 N-terminal domain-containing protein n=1 Tax=Tritrichomonas foetus TaxID=1144522 RepID=A0A1J4KJ62_9EUKA|nr:hypothetical protein TRFO_04082 [Tritrichomonas foetus]|eukprot:OHT11122.1 hypothetical protein TRFO_04082 [Tritrichomonas foetus]